MKRLFFLSIIFFLFTHFCFAQKKTRNDQEELEKSLERMQQQMMQELSRGQKELEKMLNGGMLQNFEKMLKDFEKDDSFLRMRKILKEVERQGFDQFSLGGLSEEDYTWLETERERILVLKVPLQKEAPFDIKVEKGQIMIKGVFEKKQEFHDPSTGSKSSSIQRRQFSQSFAIPSDVNGDKVRFEQKDQEIRVTLPKRIPSKAKKSI